MKKTVSKVFLVILSISLLPRFMLAMQQSYSIEAIKSGAAILDYVKQSAANAEGIEKLLSLGADVNAIDSSGRTALANIITKKSHDDRDRFAIVQTLLRNMSPQAINYKDVDGMTPLMYAARMPSPVYVMSLLIAGARPGIVQTTFKNVSYKAYSFAKAASNREAEYLLLKAEELSKDSQKYQEFLNLLKRKILRKGLLRTIPEDEVFRLQQETRTRQARPNLGALIREQMTQLPEDSLYNWTFIDAYK